MNNSVLDVKVLGTKSSSHQMVVSLLKEFLQRARVPFVLKQVDDVSVFLKEGLSSVPAIQAAGKTYSLSDNGVFNKSLRDAVRNILKEVNFGEMEKIVIPVDFSEVSMNAFLYGHQLATDIGAVVKALHVYFPTSRELSESSVVNVDFKALRQDHLNEFVEKLDVDWGSEVLKNAMIDGEFRVGFPGEEILDSIRDNSCELLIMGTTGDSSTIKKWFGSVSTKMMNDAPCNVLLIPEEAKYKEINDLVYAYDDINLDVKVLEKLLAFAKKFDATIHFLHVNDDEEVDPGFFLKEQIVQDYPAEKVKFQMVRSGDVADAIQNYAKEVNVDVLALATKNRSFFGKIFHQSVSQKIALHAELPLLILKP
jgi:nucleotide-binding universal stress UspA family protein